MAKRHDVLRHFFGGFVRLHLLHHAEREGFYGAEMIAELQRHGYQLSPGTLYPVLHELEEEGLLACQTTVVDGKRRKMYSSTAKGRTLLAKCRVQLRELVDELFEE